MGTRLFAVAVLANLVVIILAGAMLAAEALR